jgi:hypothetical protein
MAYRDDLNAFVAQNPEDSGVPNPGVAPPSLDEGDPLVQGGADPGVQAPAPAYAGLTGDPLQTAFITSAQLTALRPRRRPIPVPRVPPLVSGLSSYLGGA